AGSYASESVRREGMPVTTPIPRVDKLGAQRDDKEDDGNFDDNDCGIKAGALFDADRQNDRDDHGDKEGGQIETDFVTKKRRRTDQIVCALDKFRRVRSGYGLYFVHERLGSGNKGWVGGYRHLFGDCCGRRSKASPMIVSEPKRHFEMKDVEQLDE